MAVFSFDDWDPGRMHDYDRGGMMDGTGAWVAMLLGFLFLLALTGIAIFWIAKATGPASVSTSRGPGTPSSPPASAPSPQDVLDMRLARGEITPEEYGATRQLLDH